MFLSPKERKEQFFFSLLLLLLLFSFFVVCLFVCFFFFLLKCLFRWHNLKCVCVCVFPLSRFPYLYSIDSARVCFYHLRRHLFFFFFLFLFYYLQCDALPLSLLFFFLSVTVFGLIDCLFPMLINYVRPVPSFCFTFIVPLLMSV